MTVAIEFASLASSTGPESSPLLNDEGELIGRPGMEQVAKLLEFETKPWADKDLKTLEDEARLAIATDKVDLVLMVEPQFSAQLEERVELARQIQIDTESVESDSSDVMELAADETAVDDQATTAEPAAELESAVEPRQDGLRIVGNLARDRSQMARRRLDAIINAWQKNWVSTQLTSAGVSPRVFEPLAMVATDTAPPDAKRAMIWSKILPFIMLIWALTGAFYPAIDLCAGEKERGTLETLLSSPARRREIVWGKLGTIGVFSIASALLNLISMHLTAGIIVKQMAAQGTPQLAETLGPMPIHALGWLVLLLLPMAAFFSALALAVAAPRSQYQRRPILLDAFAARHVTVGRHSYDAKFGIELGYEPDSRFWRDLPCSLLDRRTLHRSSRALTCRTRRDRNLLLGVGSLGDSSV